MSDIPRGVWLGASVRLGRPVPISEPYPHVCGADALYPAQRRDCVACAEQARRDRQEHWL